MQLATPLFTAMFYSITTVQALSVIDNVLVVTAFPLYFLPTFVDYSGLYPDYIDLSLFHQIVLVYVLPVAFVAQTATIWVTVLVAVNRYIAVCRPYQVRHFETLFQFARWIET